MIQIRNYIAEEMLLTTRYKKSRFVRVQDYKNETVEVYTRTQEDAVYVREELMKNGFKYGYLQQQGLSGKRAISRPWEHLRFSLIVLMVKDIKKLTETIRSFGYTEITYLEGGFVCLG